MSLNHASTHPNLPLFSVDQWDAQQQVLTLNINGLSETPLTPTKLLLTGWQRGIAWYLLQAGEPEGHSNPFAPSLFPIEFLDSPLLTGWRETIPADVLQHLRIYSSNPFGLLMILSRDQAACELFVDHPVLFCLLYFQAQWQGLGLPWLLRNCRLKRVDALSSCDFPRQPSAVTLLKKLKFSGFTRRQFDLICQVFQLDYWLLNHQPRISHTLLQSVIRHPVLLSCQLLAHWQDKDAQLLHSTLTDIQRLQRHGGFSPKRMLLPLRQCKQVQDVVRLHDRLVGIVNRKSATGVRDDIAYPPPPLPGTEAIVPITDYAQLHAESVTQHHCVNSYHADILAGSYYVYRVLVPERATLGVSILYPGHDCQDVVVDQLKGLRNGEVCTETWQAVETWLFSHRSVGKRHD